MEANGQLDGSQILFALMTLSASEKLQPAHRKIFLLVAASPLPLTSIQTALT